MYLVWAATDDELGSESVAAAEDFWRAFDEALDPWIPRQFRALPLGAAVVCAEEEHDELMRAVRTYVRPRVRTEAGRTCRAIRSSSS
jgi:hypothetical protein